MNYIRKILDNNMNIIMVPIKKSQIITMGFFIKAGSRNEMEDDSGIAHFLEHMMFKGTKHRNASTLFEELDIIGANYNAATTTQHTYYYVYGNANDTKKILDIMLDIYINAIFMPKEIATEKKVIIEEMRMRSDSPMMKLYSLMHKKMFAGTSLARDIIGNIDTIMNFTKRDLVSFRTSLYKPENTVFAITGNFNTEVIFNFLYDALNNLENSPKSPTTYFHERSIIMKNMKSQEEPYVYVRENELVQQVYVILAFPLYDLYEYKYSEIDLLTQLLTSGFSSRLSKALRENKGITYTSNAYPIVYSDSGVYLITLVINPVELVKGLKITLNELKKIKNKPVTDKEMEKVINVTKNESIYTLINPISILTYFGINFLIDRNFNPDINKEFNKISKITKQQLQNVARQIFVYDKINLFLYGNVKKNINFDFLDL